MNTVTAGLGTDVHYCIADSGSPALLDIFLVHQAHTHGIAEHVSLVTGVKGRFPCHRWDTHAVAVVANPTDRVRHLHPGLVVIQFAKVKGVERRHRPGTHAKNVTEDAANTSCRPLVRFHRGGVVMAFRFENHRLPIVNVNYPGAFTRALQYPGTLVREEPEHRFRLFVRTMLTPHRGKESRLGIVRQATEELFADVVIFVLAQAPV